MLAYCCPTIILSFVLNLAADVTSLLGVGTYMYLLGAATARPLLKVGRPSSSLCRSSRPTFWSHRSHVDFGRSCASNVLGFCQ